MKITNNSQNRLVSLTVGATGPSGTQGATGAQGHIGEDGAQGIQGRQGTTGVGIQGIQGVRGNTGSGLQVAGTVSLISDLPPSANDGDGYIVIEDSNLYIYSSIESGYINAGQILGAQGALGAQGTTGASVQGATGSQGLAGIQGATGGGILTGGSLTANLDANNFAITNVATINATSANVATLNASVLRVTSNVAGNLIPSLNEVYDLGSPTHRWRDLYLSGTTINLGGVSMSSDGSAISLPAGSTIGGVSAGTLVLKGSVSTNTNLPLSPTPNIGDMNTPIK